MLKTNLPPWVVNKGASRFKINWERSHANQFPTIAIGTEDVTGNVKKVEFDKNACAIKMEDTFFFENHTTWKGEKLLDCSADSFNEAQDLFFEKLSEEMPGVFPS